jgi:hypothetical protein
LTKRAVSSDVTTKEFGKKIDGQEFEAVDDVGACHDRIHLHAI